MKNGYVITKNALAKEFFTASSAYDRPQWIGLTEATVYPTAELADRAVRKLYKNGSYQANVVSLSEMNLDIEPIEGREDELSLGDDLGDADPTADDELDGDDEPEMKAAEQNDVCPECEHEPCTCPEHDDDISGEDDLDVDSGSEIDDEFGGEFDDLVDNELDGEEVGDIEFDGEDPFADENEQEADPRFDGRRLGMAQLSPMGGPRRLGGLGESAVKSINIKDPAQNTKDDNAFAGDSKVTVPANVKSELKAVIAKFEKEAEYHKNDDARASFGLTVAAALQDILDCLNHGTVEGVKRANVKMTSYMNPITSHIPPAVVKFITSGGAKPSLKDLFNTKREERK